MSRTNFSTQKDSKRSTANGENAFSEMRSLNNIEFENSGVSFLKHPSINILSIPDKELFLNQKLHPSFEEQFYAEDYDVNMESDNSSSLAACSLLEEQFANKNNDSSNKFPLKPLKSLKQITSMTSISNLTPVTSKFSIASTDSYFSYSSSCSTKGIEHEKVIPTKSNYKSVKSVLPPNPAVLLSSKPTLSWIPICNSNENNPLMRSGLINHPGPSKASFTISPLMDANIQDNVDTKPKNLKDSHENTHMIKTKNKSFIQPSLTESIPMDVNHLLNPFVTAATPLLPRNCKVRRTHSMFQHPKDVFADDIKDSIVVNENASPSPRTPITEYNSVFNMKDCPIKTFNVKEDQFKRMDPETLCKIMDGIYSGLYERYLIIDCRFEYEFNGGHIEGAININSTETLEETLFSNVPVNERVLLIFHCEYSSHRGPRMAMHLRNIDRKRNINRYPYLHYPDIAILSGGYSLFFSQFNMRCYPQKYVEMNDNSHKVACEREMGRFRRSMKLSRTQSELFSSDKLSRLKLSFMDYTDDDNDNVTEPKDVSPSLALDQSPLVNASKSYSCFELSNPGTNGVNNKKKNICKGKRDCFSTNVNFNNSDDLQTTPTSCNSQFRRKLGVKLNFSKF